MVQQKIIQIKRLGLAILMLSIFKIVSTQIGADDLCR